jgi:hypothetical protein
MAMNPFRAGSNRGRGEAGRSLRLATVGPQINVSGTHIDRRRRGRVVGRRKTLGSNGILSSSLHTNLHGTDKQRRFYSIHGRGRHLHLFAIFEI